MEWEDILKRVIFENDFGTEDFVDGKTAEILANKLCNSELFLGKLEDVIAVEVEKELKNKYKELFRGGNY